MQLFELTVDRNDWRRYQIKGEHAWSLPPLACGVCGSRWKTTGEAYPTVNVGELANAYPVTEQQPLRNEEFERLRGQVAHLAPEGAPLQPGASFGPFHGVARGRFFDIVWHESWTMFLQSDAFTQLSEHGVRMPPFAAPCLVSKGRSTTKLPSLVEPEAVPRLDFSLKSLREPR